MEIYWRDNFTCPTESEYQQMTIRKTGGLFMLAIRLMQLFSDNKRDFSKLTAILGLYFQIRDDYCNLICKEVCSVDCDCWLFSSLSLEPFRQLISLFICSTPKTKVSVRIWPKGNSVFRSFMPSTIRSKIDKCYVSFFKLNAIFRVIWAKWLFVLCVRVLDIDPDWIDQISTLRLSLVLISDRCDR